MNLRNNIPPFGFALSGFNSQAWAKKKLSTEKCGLDLKIKTRSGFEC